MDRPGKAAILRAAVEVRGEDGSEGASMRDMAARSGVSVAALYYHFPSKLDLLREFLDEAYDVILARLERRLAAVTGGPEALLDEVVATLIASHLHDDWARLASNVAWREHTRLTGAERKAIDDKRLQLLLLVEDVLRPFGVRDRREAARAIITLSTSLAEPFADMGRSMADVIEVYQGFARSIARG